MICECKTPTIDPNIDNVLHDRLQSSKQIVDPKINRTFSDSAANLRMTLAIGLAQHVELAQSRMHSSAGTGSFKLMWSILVTTLLLDGPVPLTSV